jgi:hypothetical protein
MNTWIKFQIDYIERQIRRKLNAKEKKFIGWFLKLPKSDQKKLLEIDKFIK